MPYIHRENGFITAITNQPNGSDEWLPDDDLEVTNFHNQDQCCDSSGVKTPALTCTYCCKKVNEHRDTIYNSNLFSYSGKLWQTTADKQFFVATRVLRAKAVLDGQATWEGRLLTYKSLDNTPVDFPTAQSFLDFAIAYQDYCVDVAGQADDQKLALEAIRDDADLTDDEKITAMEEYLLAELPTE